MWRMVNFTTTTTPIKLGGESCFENYEIQSFELEAINRPGFFLIVDAQGFLTLKDKQQHTIKFTKRTAWDNVRLSS